MHEYLLDSVEVAKRLNVSRAHVYYLIQRGDIQAVRVGGAIRVRPRDLDAFIRRWGSKQKKEPPPRRARQKAPGGGSGGA